ncbi:MAG: RidA family protein [SAR202 cluster bacterium]|jgi:enamine deaminase RidA (YjgF/YER057c/UK114 family)|nr:RidA family protein [SAR202 cluster bacterium]MDP6714163.1 RidA family protein [SAR202 cluster bacterium]
MSGSHRQVVNTQSAPQPIGDYSQAIRTSTKDLLFIAGQVSVDMEGNVVGKGDAAAQTRQIFENLGNILSSQGASFSDVVEFTTYVVGRESSAGYREARAEVYPSLFPDRDFPANTLLIISGLASEDFLVEISAIAAIPD